MSRRICETSYQEPVGTFGYYREYRRWTIALHANTMSKNGVRGANYALKQGSETRSRGKLYITLKSDSLEHQQDPSLS